MRLLPLSLAIRLLAAAGAFAAGSALAQTATTLAPPPEKFAVSPGGVDMRSGRYAYRQTDLSIGGDAGVSLTRSMAQQVAGHNNPFANFSHDFDILLSEKRINIQQGIFRHTLGQPDYQIEVNFGGRSQAFRALGSSGGFEQTSRSGYAQLTFTGDKSSSSVVYTFRTGDGTEAIFRPLGTAANAECSSQLRCAYVAQVTSADGTRLTFEYDNLGGQNTTRLRSVTSNRGYALLLEYNGANVSKACVLNLTLMPKPANNVCPANAHATSSYTYGSVGSAVLASATDPTGAVWTFVNASNSIGFVNPGDSVPWLTNGFIQRMNDDGLIEQIVTSQQFADGSSYSYAFDESPLVEGHISQIAGGTFTDANAGTTTLAFAFPVAPHSTQNSCTDNGCPFYYFENTPQFTNSYQITPGPVTVTDPLGRTTTYDYCDPTAMANLPQTEHNRCVVTPAAVSTTDPEGIATHMTWDYATRNLLQTRQVARPGSVPALPDILRSATYNCTPANFRFCAKPITQTDARNNVTDYTYAAAHGGLLTETAPLVPVRQPNGTTVNIRPQTRYDYTQRNAWISNGAGGYVQVTPPVWLLTATSLCRTSAATGIPATPCATAGDEVRTVFDYGPGSGPNNLLLRGQAVTATDSGVTTTLRTCYGYDALGRRISETQPNANLGSCP